MVTGVKDLPLLAFSRLLQVQHPPDEEAASAQRRRPVREAPPSPQQGGVSPREAAAAETGRLVELTQLAH